MAFPYNPHVPGTGVHCGPCGSPGNQFPYTVQHSANLDYICETVAKTMQAQLATNDAFTALDADFEKLVEYVNNYFADTDIPLVVGAWMDDFVSSGQMAELVKAKIGEYAMLFPDDSTNAYGYTARGEMLYIAISWLLCDVDSNCIKHPTTGGPDLPCLFSYSQTKNWRGYVNHPRSYVGTDTAMDLNGINRPVVYFDCSSFVAMVTAGYFPSRSLIQYSISNHADPVPNNIDDLPGLNFLLESPDFPWTFDFLGRTKTPQMAMLMDSSGNPIYTVATIKNGESPTLVYTNLNSCDILFKGSQNQHDAYKGIYHCGLFIHPSAMENPAQAFPGLVLKAYNNHTSNVGYILECTGGTTTGKYSNVLRLVAFEDWLTADPGDTSTIYAARPVTNLMLSNKRRSRYTMDILEKDRIYYTDRLGNILGQRNVMDNWTVMEGSRVAGERLGLNFDLDAFRWGIYRTSVSEEISSIRGTPPFDLAGCRAIVLLQHGGGSDKSRNGNCQFFLARDDQINKMALRFYFNGEWLPWSVWEGK